MVHSHKTNLHKKSSFKTFYFWNFWGRGAYIVEGFYAHLLSCSNVTQRHFHNWVSPHNHMNMSHITVMMIWWRRKINCSLYFVKLIDMLSNRSHYVLKIISDFFRFYYCAYACHFFSSLTPIINSDMYTCNFSFPFTIDVLQFFNNLSCEIWGEKIFFRISGHLWD